MKYRAYKSIFRIKLISGLQYRAAALAGISINLFWGLILTTMTMIFYKFGNSKSTSMSMVQAVTYIWFAQCFINLVPLQPDSEVYKKIVSGDIAYELCRPLNLYTHWYMRSAAFRLSNTILKSGLALVVCLLLPPPYRMQLPVSLFSLIATILALIGALLLSCSISNLMNIMLLRVELGPGFVNLLNALIVVFSGLLVPLSLFPDWLHPILRALPFAGLMDFPSGLYTGVIPTSQLFFVLAKQLLWTSALILLGQWRLNKGLKKLVIQGA